MKRFLTFFSIALISAVTGCATSNDVVTKPVAASNLGSDFHARTPLPMGAGDSLGERIFTSDALARGPVVIETASISGD